MLSARSVQGGERRNCMPQHGGSTLLPLRSCTSSDFGLIPNAVMGGIHEFLIDRCLVGDMLAHDSKEGEADSRPRFV